MPKDCSNCTFCRINQIYLLGHDPEPDSRPASPSPALISLPSSTTASSYRTAVMAPITGEDASHRQKVDRSLRMITIATWLPSFPFLLAHGIITSTFCPVLGIVPMTVSALFGLIHVAGRAKRRTVSILIDTFLVAFFLGTLIPGWIFMADDYSWRNSSGTAIVGTYGTMGMIVNMLIHAYFVLREFQLRNPFGRAAYCLHCHEDLWSRSPIRLRGETMSEHSDDSKESYEPLTTADATAEEGAGRGKGKAMPAEAYNDLDTNQPRPSTDDETARLV